ncbi:hypothetical protein MHO82_09025 [Vibrio sp. Of7-15]|uniref:hypothetical protein n=1 Tax=Vibrio sp. Of7-15 TaxID=2724879 RepID=UPI001EF3A1CA|nr:hypothetical protein [Vibrio sp. Of7-15]MCG7497006.1 hypothetical protein [Vibrio sp. Of7-15]
MHFLALLLLFFAVLPTAYAEQHFTLSYGFSTGGEVTENEQEQHTINGAPSFSVRLETDIDEGRIGLFYSHQSSKLEHYDLDSQIDYFHLQSALDYELKPLISSFVGASLGASYIQTQWSNKDYFFSGSLFTGLAYSFSSNIKVSAEGRWLSSAIETQAYGQCTAPSSSSECNLKFSGKWLHQIQTQIALTLTF